MTLDRAMPLVCLVSYDEILAERIAIALDPQVAVERSRPEPDALAAVAESARPDAWMVDLDEASADGGASLAALQQVLEVAVERPVIAVSADFSGPQVLAAMRMGASDFLDKAEIGDRLADQLQRWIEGRRSTGGRRGSVLATLAMLPGTGVSALAEAMAGQIVAREAAERVLLIDLTSGRALADMLETGQKPYSLSDALGDLGRFDDSLIETAFARAADERIFLLEDDPERHQSQGWHDYDLMTLISVLRRWFPWTVVAAHYDFSGGVFHRLYREADEVVLACDQRLGNVKALAGYLNSRGAESRPAGRVRLAVTRADKRLSPKPPQVVEKFDLGDAVILPDARVELDMAANARMSIAAYAPHSEFVARVRALTDRALSVEALRPARGAWRLKVEPPSRIFRQLIGSLR